MKPRRPTTNFWIALILFAGTLALYARTARFDFVNFDDGGYAYENPRVRAGLSADNIAWAFTTGAESNWHPVTWLSLMMDSSLFGMNPGWMHLENALLHAASAALLFIVLVEMTQARWPSAWVAAMFAWHPLHVESVAWISERKDVLSALFMMLGLLAYVRYTRAPIRRRYLFALAFLILGLMSKPMLVTLPCVMLLLDAWPLRRMGMLADARKCLIEKVPMFAVVLASAVATYLVQSAGRSVTPVGKLSIGLRIANSLIAYVRYLRLTFVPRGLAVFYPLRETYAGGRTSLRAAAIGAGVLALITALTVALRRRKPWLLVGWLWYLGMLVPVIGLVQVGSQSHADRYTYLPLIGIFIALAWSARCLAERSSSLRAVVVAVAVASVVAVIPLTWRQIGYWQNSFTVMQHAADVVPNNYVALASLGEAYDRAGQHDMAAALYEQTLHIHPNDALALNNLAIQAAARGENETARRLYRESLDSDPNYAPAYNNYGNVLMRLGRRDDAIAVYRAGIKRDPDFAPIKHNLALALAEGGALDEAIALWHQALAIDPVYADAHESLGNALILRGQTRDGIAELKEALRLTPDRVGAFKSLAWIYSTHPSPLYQNASEAQKLATRAVELKPDDAVAQDTLAAAYARAGKFDQAIDTAERASSLAEAQQNGDLTKQIQKRLDLYRSHQPFTSGR